jgi:3-hydroxy-9,10-secoandrosta-1,3,5(10)-triene-9,17-dione monooxygenase reductase component
MSEMGRTTVTAPREPDPALFRRAMGSFPTGVTLVTRGAGENLQAMTANSVTSVSLEPLLVMVGVTATGRIGKEIRAEGSFAINILAREQQYLSKLFAKSDRPSGLAAAEHLGGNVGATGNGFVDGALATMECVLEQLHPAGDHILLLGRVTAIHLGDPTKPPLVFFRGGYTELVNG